MARRNRRRGKDRTQTWIKGFKIGSMLALLGVAGFYGYEVGQKLTQEELAAANQELTRLAGEAAGSRDRLASLESQLGQAQASAEDYRRRYEAVAPSEQMAGLVAALRAKLATGLDPKRLALAISAAEPPRNCVKAETRRFIVKTAKYSGPNTWVRFNETVVVSADGAGEKRASGATEEWYDPNQVVTVSFTPLGGKETRVSGRLPIQHSMVFKNAEYRFTIAPGVRGFAEVTGDRCEFRGAGGS